MEKLCYRITKNNAKWGRKSIRYYRDYVCVIDEFIKEFIQKDRQREGILTGNQTKVRVTYGSTRNKTGEHLSLVVFIENKNVRDNNGIYITLYIPNPEESIANLGIIYTYNIWDHKNKAKNLRRSYPYPTRPINLHEKGKELKKELDKMMEIILDFGYSIWRKSPKILSPENKRCRRKMCNEYGLVYLENENQILINPKMNKTKIKKECRLLI